MASGSQHLFGELPGRGRGEQSVASGTAISRIESLLECLIDSVSSAEPMSIHMLSRRSVRSRREQAVPTRVCFPGRSLHEAQKFARIVFILQLAHDALVSNTVLTKRSIFYQHQDLFETQKVVDQLVDDIAITLSLDRSDLNIVASAKGIVAGPLRIQFLDGREQDASSGGTGIVIPPAASIAGINVGPIRWILVIEKDATFRSLSTSQYWERSGCGQGLLITARGYPDMVTQSFLYSLSLQRPDVPIFVLADFDPDGINIFHCYLYGSGRILPDPATFNQSIRWLGIKSCHVESLEPFLHETTDAHNVSEGERLGMLTGLPGSLSRSVSNLNSRSSTLRLSLRDRKTIVDTLERYTSRGDSSLITLVLRRELQIMQMLGYKAEIQILDDSGNLDAWLDYNLASELISV
ncbi:hypothetical protein E4U41_004619 [Claviceps citrina]|nr:hypothetical protein E4U41_004619 [Claviceps citrina]